ncbi:putative peptidoglycan lipid II flippase [Salisediminibacterium halotolerans]|nr:putative peptidoglycan lipid II flippase [Actinophytocola xinjiangensis]RPE89550.1 putative peptidoglycan lipid II flippase [Salisediminibacterium halotolerans]TWG36309.1 putative peptidoglycan lipid II flippase [Salisediminibacterium halotolerans]
MIISIISSIIGFFREITLSYFYGASSISDVYLIALTIPGVIFTFIGSAISSGYIPMHTRIDKEYGAAYSQYYTNNLINIIMVFCTFIVFLTFIFTEQIVLIFASGFSGETLQLAVQFTRISIFGIYFTALVNILKSYLNIRDVFVITGLIALPLNLVIISSIVMSAVFAIEILAYGSVLAVAVQVLFLLPSALKNGYKHTFVLNLKDKHINKMMLLALPIIAGNSVNQINKIVDRTIASQVAEGGISALNYADRLVWFIETVFVLSIITVIYPKISKMAADDHFEGMKTSIAKAVNAMNLLVIPAMIGFMFFSAELISFLFGRGAFDARALEMTSAGLFFYAVGMFGFGLREVLSKAFYSLQDTKTPMINGAIGMVVNIVLNVILAYYMGIAGIALATSIAAIVTALLMFISLRKKIGALGINQLLTTFVKTLFAALTMGVITKLSYEHLITVVNDIVALFLVIFAGIILYSSLIYFMKIDDVDVIVHTIKRKFARE